MSTDIGSYVEIIVGVPATFDKAGYEALFAGSEEEIGGVVSVGETGTEDSMIPIPQLKTGFTQSAQGARQGMSVPILFKEILADAGQALVFAANGTGVEYSFRIVEPTAVDRVEYISGLVHSTVRNERSTESYPGFTTNVQLNYDPVRVAAP